MSRPASDPARARTETKPPAATCSTKDKSREEGRDRLCLNDRDGRISDHDFARALKGRLTGGKKIIRFLKEEQKYKASLEAAMELFGKDPQDSHDRNAFHYMRRRERDRLNEGDDKGKHAFLLEYDRKSETLKLVPRKSATN